MSLRGAKRRGNLLQAVSYSPNFTERSKQFCEIATAPLGPRNDKLSLFCWSTPRIWSTQIRGIFLSRGAKKIECYIMRLSYIIQFYVLYQSLVVLPILFPSFRKNLPVFYPLFWKFSFQRIFPQHFSAETANQSASPLFYMSFYVV